MDKAHVPLQQLIFNSIANTDIDTRKEFYKNIVLSGGNTIFLGIEQRLVNELKSLTPNGTIIKIADTQKRNLLPYQGASFLSMMPVFADMWITKEEYDTSGAKIVHSKC